MLRVDRTYVRHRETDAVDPKRKWRKSSFDYLAIQYNGGQPARYFYLGIPPLLSSSAGFSITRLNNRVLGTDEILAAGSR